jgi:hypothetical protein
MNRAFVLALLIGLFAISTVRADIALPPDFKYVEPMVRFEGVDKHEDYVFYLRYQTGNGNPFAVPASLVEIKDAKAFPMRSQRRIADTHVLAMVRKDFDARKASEPSMDWFKDKTPGVLRANIATPNNILNTSKEKKLPVMTYRVAIKDGKLSAETVKESTEKRSEAGPSGLMSIGVFAAVAAAIGAGLWFVRRKTGTV